MPNTAPVLAPTAGRTDPTKRYPPPDVRSTILDPSSPDPMETIALPSAIPRNTHVATNTTVEPTEELKNVVNNIIEAITLLTSPISY